MKHAIDRNGLIIALVIIALAVIITDFYGDIRNADTIIVGIVSGMIGVLKGHD